MLTTPSDAAPAPALLLGVDGGGTRTRAVLLEASATDAASNTPAADHLVLRELGRGEAASCNHYSVGWEVALHNLIQAALAALLDAGRPAQPLDPTLGWGLGLAGAVSDAECREWSQRLRQRLLGPHARLHIAEDALAAQCGAFERGPGAILIAGTGANAFGRDARNRTARADGLGPLLGDRGSGFWIGQAALSAVSRHHDGIQPCPLLHAAVLSALGVPDVPALVPLIYAPSWTKDRTAALVPAVNQAAENGDAGAQDILRAAGTELAHTALSVLQPLEIESVALMGGVLEHVPRVRHAFDAALSQGLPQARIVAPRHDAAVGAALLVLSD